MKHVEEYWEKAAREAKEKKELQNKYSLLGKKVRRKGRKGWEEGIVVLDSDEWTDGEELFIKFSKNDLEGLDGLPFEIWDEKLKKWVK